MKLKYLRYSPFSMLLVFAALIAGCGGGGGGDGFSGAGRVFLSAQPSRIDVGDRTRIQAEASEVNEDGIIVKFRYPDGLEYVMNSAFLEVDGEEIDLGPDVNVISDNDVYLVFFIGVDEFEDAEKGILTFQLEGLESVNNGEVSVNIDVDDALIDNNVEFDVENPEFQAEDTVLVDVEA